jgi:hypothetical protein
LHQDSKRLHVVSTVRMGVPESAWYHSLVERLLTHVLPNSLHFRHGTSLSHFTFSLEHSSHACRFRPLSNELGISEVPRFSQRLKWSRNTSLGRKLSAALLSFLLRLYIHVPAFEGLRAEFATVWSIAGVYACNLASVPAEESQSHRLESRGKWYARCC